MQAEIVSCGHIVIENCIALDWICKMWTGFVVKTNKIVFVLFVVCLSFFSPVHVLQIPV